MSVRVTLRDNFSFEKLEIPQGEREKIVQRNPSIQFLRKNHSG